MWIVSAGCSKNISLLLKVSLIGKELDPDISAGKSWYLHIVEP